MSRLDQESEVIELARTLGLPDDRPVDAIVGFCRDRIDGWIAETDGVENVDQLEALVLRRLQMAFEEIWWDEDFERLKEEYARKRGEIVFATLAMQFDEKTFGALICLKNVSENAPIRYVAVIDCRGDKAQRRFFTRWHEIAHRLTTPGKYPGVFFRSAKDPLERLMDEIAGRVGFHEPMLIPTLSRHLGTSDRLSFRIVEAVRQERFSSASFQATLFACMRCHRLPVVYLRAAPAHKAKNRRELASGQGFLFAETRPVATLRAVEVMPNPPAQEVKLLIPTNMRVPESSLIHRLFSSEVQGESAGAENLSAWEDSNRNRLEDRAVWVEARRYREEVWATVQIHDGGTME